MSISEKYIEDFKHILIFCALVFLGGLVKINIPGITGIDSNLLEIPLLIGAFYLRKYWYIFFLGFTTITSSSDGVYLVTFLPHIISLLIFRFAYLRVNKPIENTFWNIAVWIALVVFYYFVLIIPSSLLISYMLEYNTQMDFFAKYKSLLIYSVFEQIATIIVTTLFLVQYRLKIALNKHLSEVEYTVKLRTEELQAANEELQVINEDLFNKNNIINQKNDELTKTIRNLKETQQQLVQSEKMASLGTLTAGVAHEINNPLNYIMGAHVGFENYFDEFGSANKPETDILQNSIKVGIERISGIVKGLNQFSRNNENLDENCDIHTILENCLVMLHNKTKNKVEIVKQYTNNPIITKGNVGKLHQVFINILTNAYQSILESGTILINTKIEGSNTIIEIIDNGIGIEKKNLPNITDPFFTTKPPGEGTGLGLSISHTIIKEHKGNLIFESEENKGTKVKVILPISK